MVKKDKKVENPESEKVEQSLANLEKNGTLQLEQLMQLSQTVYQQNKMIGETEARLLQELNRFHTSTPQRGMAVVFANQSLIGFGVYLFWLYFFAGATIPVAILMAKIKLSSAQIDFLQRIKKWGELSISNTNRTADALEKRGLITWVRQEGFHYVWDITEAGRERLN